jgi:hypothetical protein
MEQITLRNWHAKRAGGRITLTGYKMDGTYLKVPGIDAIEGVLDCVRAVHADGRVFVLIPESL